MAETKRKLTVQLPAEKGARLREILRGRQILPGYTGLSEEEAVEIVMLLDGVDKNRALFRVKMSRGEIIEQDENGVSLEI